MVTPAARRGAVAHLRTILGLSERRACTIIAADRSTVRYRAKRPDDLALRPPAGTGRSSTTSPRNASPPSRILPCPEGGSFGK